ncbi:hypothetical protein PRIPAC_93093, partial [Pristionchus pacificus]|uniref:Uncharacterized protein n=1 Tax=Pristionchus pacificus TaxID=54126 RepID=A0A2A6CID3_PRIPA
MIFYLLLASCCLAYASEEWINKEESFVFDQNTLFNLNKENQDQCLRDVSWTLFKILTKEFSIPILLRYPTQIMDALFVRLWKTMPTRGYGHHTVASKNNGLAGMSAMA